LFKIVLEPANATAIPSIRGALLHSAQVNRSNA